MSVDNSSLPDFRAIELNTLALEVLQEAAISTASIAIQYSLSSVLFGVLTILVITAVYFLISRGSVARNNGKILLISTILLYFCTATYMAAVIWTGSSGNHLISEAANGLFSPSYDGPDKMAAFERALHKQSLMLTIALGGDSLIGDAIVWWRACVIWQHKAVNCVGLLLLTSTTICGIIGVVKSQGIPGLAFLIQGNVYAQLAAFLSLSTNIIATSLIAYKAWKHRRLMKRYFAGAWTTSRVFKALALLIESGCIYCALLIFVIVYQANSPTAQVNPFTTVAAHFTYGCFLPLVAIYPTIIIVLVALKRSPIDTAGLSQVRSQDCDGRDSGTEGGTFSTIIFHHSTFRTSASVEMESGAEGLPAGNHSVRHSLETPAGEGGAKVISSLA